MQIVIDIDDDVYKRIKKREPEPNDAFYCYDSVLYGTPLPKSHGDLIDRRKAISLYADTDMDVATYEVIADLRMLPTIVKGGKS